MKTHLVRFRDCINAIHRLVGINYVVVSCVGKGTFQLYLHSAKPSEICRVDLLLETVLDKDGEPVIIHPTTVLHIVPGTTPLSDVAALLRLLEQYGRFNLTKAEYCAALREQGIPVNFSR